MDCLIQRVQWMLIVQLTVPELLVVSRTTFPSDVDLDVILGISPRTTTIDYDMADFDEQAYGPTYGTGTIENKPSKSSVGKGTNNTGHTKPNKGLKKFVMMRPDSNDNVDGPLLSDPDDSNNQASTEDNILSGQIPVDLSADSDKSVSSDPDPDIDNDSISTNNRKKKLISVLSKEVTVKSPRSKGNPPDSAEKSASSKKRTTSSSSRNKTVPKAKSFNLTFSSCFGKNLSSSAASSDFCRFTKAVNDVCEAHFSSVCHNPEKSRASWSSDKQSLSYKFTSTESTDEEISRISLESTDYDSFRVSLESLGSADMSDNEMNEVLKIVKSLCPEVCSAAKRKNYLNPDTSRSDSGADSKDSSADSTESSAHSSIIEEDISDGLSEEDVNSEPDGTDSEADSYSSKTGSSTKHSKSNSRKKSKTKRKKSKTDYSYVNSEVDRETDSDAD